MVPRSRRFLYSGGLFILLDKFLRSPSFLLLSTSKCLGSVFLSSSYLPVLTLFFQAQFLREYKLVVVGGGGTSWLGSAGMFRPPIRSSGS